MRIQNDPFKTVLRIVRKRYSRAHARIYFVDKVKAKGLKKGACGLTIFPDDGKAPEIQISAGIPVWGAVEVLAHELAHLVLGRNPKGGPHGPAWEKTFRWIHREFCAQTRRDDVK